MIIECKDLSVHKDHRQINNITMQVPRGEIYTLIELDNDLKHLLIETLFTRNAVYKGQKRLFEAGMSDETFKRLALVRDNPIFFEDLSVEKNLQLHLAYSGFHKTSVIDEVIKHLDLEDVKELKVKDLSLRLKKKLAFGRAVLTEPELLVLDETLDAMDSTSVRQMLDILKHLHEKNKMTVFLTSHNLALVDKFTQTIAVMYKGQVLLESKMADLRKTYTSYFEVETNQVAEAALVLEEMSLKFRVFQPALLRVYDVQSDQAVLKAFLDRGILIRKFHFDTMRLEDIYEEIVGKYAD